MQINKKIIVFIFSSLLLPVLAISADFNYSFDSLPNWALGPFIRPVGINPILSPGNATFFDPMSHKTIEWESNDVFNPAAVLKEDKIFVLYRAEDKSGTGIGGRTSRIGLAESNDGLTMKRSSKPVLFPADDNQKKNEWPGGCEDPRVAVTSNGLYVIVYTQWNRKLPRLAVATSKDLTHWTKYGPAFRKAYHGLFLNIASKSASIITGLKQGKQSIAKINGKYWMYWGEQHVYAATSDDLINWSPLIEKDSSLKILASPRKGYFDSQLTECGPPAIITDKGIILLYNGKNASDNSGDTNYTSNSYCAGQMLFDKVNPQKLIDRLDKPFLKPEAAFEKSGQYPAGTVFIEGLVLKENKWFLYYGCADSRVAVAVYTIQQKTDSLNKFEPNAKVKENFKDDWADLRHYATENKILPSIETGENRVVFLGSSIFEFWKNRVPQYFSNKLYIDRGVSGQISPQLLIRFRQDVIDLKPKAVIILAGSNDIGGSIGHVSYESIMNNIKSMVELARLNQIKVILCTYLPINNYPDKIIALNSLIKNYAAENNITLLDYFTPLANSRNMQLPEQTIDGVHPNVAGYQIMAKVTDEAISKALK